MAMYKIAMHMLAHNRPELKNWFENLGF